mgnify:CR=1 FL=1
MKKTLIVANLFMCSFGLVFSYITKGESKPSFGAEQTQYTLQSMLKNIWDNEGPVTDELFTYDIGYGSLSTGSTPIGYHQMTKSNVSKGDFIGGDACIDWGGERLQTDKDNRCILKIKAIRSFKISISCSAVPTGWNDPNDGCQLNYYNIQGDIDNTKWYATSKVKSISIISNTTEISDIDYEMTINRGNTFAFEYGRQWDGKGYKRTWQNAGDSITFSFEKVQENQVLTSSEIVTNIAANNGQDVTDGFAVAGIKHGNVEEDIISLFNNISTFPNPKLSTLDSSTEVQNWKISSNHNDAVIYTFKALEYCKFKTYRLELGNDWLEGSYLRIYVNKEKVKEVYFSSDSPDLSSFDFETTLKIDDTVYWEFAFAGEINTRNIAMKDGGDIVKSLPQFSFLEIEHTHSWSELANGRDCTCENNGWLNYSSCECGLYAEDNQGLSIIGGKSDLETWKVTANKGLIPAIGHDYSNVDYQWSEDYLTCTASRCCSHCNRLEEETVDTKFILITTPTCSTPGEAIYKATFQNSAFGEKNVEVPIPTINHILLKITGSPAYCTIDGFKDYYICTACEQYFEDEAGHKHITNLEAWKNGEGKLSAFGHEFGSPKYLWNDVDQTCTAYRTCIHGECKETESETVDIIIENGYYVATFTNPAFTQQTKKIPSKVGLIVGISVGAGVLVGGVTLGIVIHKKRRKKLLSKN